MYFKTRNQVLTRFNGEYDIVTDINQVALWGYIDHDLQIPVQDRLTIFDKVVRAFHEIQAEKENGE